MTADPAALRELLDGVDGLPYGLTSESGTSDPWAVMAHGGAVYVASLHDRGSSRADQPEAHGRLIVAAVNALPGLLDELEQLRGKAESYELLDLDEIEGRLGLGHTSPLDVRALIADVRRKLAALVRAERGRDQAIAERDAANAQAATVVMELVKWREFAGGQFQEGMALADQLVETGAELDRARNIAAELRAQLLSVRRDHRSVLHVDTVAAIDALLARTDPLRAEA